VEKVFFLGGTASVIGGFAVILYQGIMFLKNGVWNSLSLMGAFGNVSESLEQTIAANPSVADLMQKCPLSAVFIVLGLFLLWVASKLRTRYD
jgi:hypothetical protein